VTPFWAPQSAVFVADPTGLATPSVLALLLRAGAPVALIYAGDRMEPAIRHGQRILVDPARGAAPPPPGAVVLAVPGGIPDLLRVESVSGGLYRLTADADAATAVELREDAILGIAQLPSRRLGARARRARRLRIDLREALTGRPDPAPDPADTVRRKYDAQAPFYAGVESAAVSEPLLSWCRERVPREGRILVAGSGTGRESFVLAREGWAVAGIDFSFPMVDLARKEAARLGLPVAFTAADLRAHEEPRGSLAAVFFTYDVYSFLPRAYDRVALLARMAEWLAPGGVVFLSARRCGRPYEIFVLALQHLARVRDGSGGAAWGASHTRWIGTDAGIHRSFVQVFTTGALRREIEAAGYRMGPWRGNHCLLEKKNPAR
jgi:SAM-dependent methyltransferase